MIDIRQTHNYSKYQQANGWIVEKKNGTYYFIKKLPIIGSITKLQRPQNIDINYLNTLSKKNRTFHIIVEPKNKEQIKVLLAHGYKLSKNPYLPSKTLVLDLKMPSNDIFGGFKNDARGYIVKNKNLKFIRYTKSSIAKFRQAWKNAIGLKRHIPSLSNLISLKNSFNKNSLFITTINKDAGAIFLVGGKTGYYWQAFTGKDGRLTKSQYNIVWEGILWSKKMGAISFDLEGIYDERFPNKSWLGFTHFKKSFGETNIYYPGAYTKKRLPIW